jgi:hypothetical protein
MPLNNPKVMTKSKSEYNASTTIFTAYGKLQVAKK